MVNRFSIPQGRKWVLAAAASICVLTEASARIMNNTVDPVVTVTDGGTHLIVTGPLACSETEKTDLRVTVTQRSTGAVAQGFARFICTVDTQQWDVHASLQGDAVFEEGAATAVAFARTTSQGEATDSHQWLVEVTLVGE